MSATVKINTMLEMKWQKQKQVLFGFSFWNSNVLNFSKYWPNQTTKPPKDVLNSTHANYFVNIWKGDCFKIRIGAYCWKEESHFRNIVLFATLKHSVFSCQECIISTPKPKNANNIHQKGPWIYKNIFVNLLSKFFVRNEKI